MNILRFFQLVYGDNRLRVSAQRDLGPDVGRYAFNRVLSLLERGLVRQHRTPGAPIVFIVGVPRTGTTLLHQLMVRHMDVSYISNAVARYWLAPLWAMKHARTKDEIELRSDLGRTEGDAAPHEFGWFWLYHAPTDGSHHRTDAELEALDWGYIRGELEAIASWSQRPLVLKNLETVDYHIARFARELTGSKFILMERDPSFTAQSLIESRRKRYGDEHSWWSIRPRDVEAWRDRSPEDQVAHQIQDISSNIAAGLATLPPSRRMVLRYETLVQDPLRQMQGIANFVGTPLRDADRLTSSSLEDANIRRLEPSQFARIEAALRREGLDVRVDRLKADQS